MAASFILAIDQGTTSTRAMVFDEAGRTRGTAQQELTQRFPQPGWVEHDPEEIWQAVLETCRGALARAAISARDLAAIGITNQRETTLLWDRATGIPIAPAIVWQDRRTAARCDTLIAAGHGPNVQAKTGLVIDPYFSASKIAWLLDTVAGARQAAEAGRLAFGTIDSFLLWRLTGGAVHATDVTNASRTLLYDIHRQVWDPDLLTLFRIPPALLPEVRPCCAAFGTTVPALLGAAVAITGIAGDQQAATVGQACFEPGMVKSTYGTGCFLVMNTGKTAVASKHRLLTTIAYQLDAAPIYAVEGSIFTAGAAIQWLRDKLRLMVSAGEAAGLAAAADPQQRVYMIPAFTGLGAPHWDPAARAAIVGMTRDTGAPELVRAALEAACWQTGDLIEAMAADGDAKPTALRVDGGMAVNDWAMQFLADVLALPVERPVITETTALGAALLAGVTVGFYGPPETLMRRWQLERRFEPRMGGDERAERRDGWRRAIGRIVGPH